MTDKKSLLKRYKEWSKREIELNKAWKKSTAQPTEGTLAILFAILTATFVFFIIIINAIFGTTPPNADHSIFVVFMLVLAGLIMIASSVSNDRKLQKFRRSLE